MIKKFDLGNFTIRRKCVNAQSRRQPCILIVLASFTVVIKKYCNVLISIQY